VTLPDQPFIPGYGNSDPLDAATAKQILARIAPADYSAHQADLDSYIDRVASEKAFVTPRRLVEISAAARQYFGGSVEQQAHAKLVADGRSPDLAKLPEGYRTRLAATGLDDADIVDLAQKFYPNLGRKEAVAKWTEVAAKTMQDDAGPTAVTGWDGNVRGRVYGQGG
jgi:hypothetical protein